MGFEVKADGMGQDGDRRQLPANYRNIVHFFFELGMLKRTPRSGFQFLGSGRESVADHSFRVAMIGYTLSHLAQFDDPYRVVCLCLFHDVPEARTSDLNYVNKRYVQVNESQAIVDLAESLPFGAEYVALLEEYRQAGSMAAKLAHDADQLDLILELKEQADLGNNYAHQWIHFALLRLKTEVGRQVADEIVKTDSSAWWFDGHDHWWQPAQGTPRQE